MRRVNDADLAHRTLLAMTVMAPALAAAGMASAAESAPTGTPELPPDLAKAVNDYDQATIRNDIAALGDLVADDYLLVNRTGITQAASCSGAEVQS